MKESILFKRHLATFVVIVLGSPAIVLADTLNYTEHAKATVSYADLNLENEEGVRVLYQRLQYASKEVCSFASPKTAGSYVMKLSRQQATRRCYRETLFNAVDKFDNEDLARIHAG